MKKRFLSLALAIILVCSLIPTTVFAADKVGTTVTDYIYSNSQGVANDKIEISTAGGTVDLYIKLPKNVQYNIATNGQFGFDLTELTDGVTAKPSTKIELLALWEAASETEDAWHCQKTNMAKDKDGNSDLTEANSTKRPFYVWGYNGTAAFTPTDDIMMAKVRITVPAGLTADSTYTVGLTCDRKLYLGNGLTGNDATGVLEFAYEKGNTNQWTITIKDYSAIEANEVVFKTGSTITAADIISRSNVTGKLADGTGKTFSVADFKASEWAAIQSAAPAGDVGNYDLTITSGTKTKKITVTLADDVVWTDKDNYLYANDFAKQTGSAVTADEAKTAAAVAGKASGTAIVASDVTVDDVTAFSTASAASKTGDYNLTFTAGSMSVTVTGSLYDNVKNEGGVVVAANNFNVEGKSLTEAEITDAWFLAQSGAFASKDGVDGTPTVKAEDLTALKNTILADVTSDTNKTVTLSYGGKDVTVTVTVKPGDKSTVTASDYTAENGADALQTAEAFKAAVNASGTNKDGTTIDTWTDANFEGLDEVREATAPGTYTVTVKPTTGDATHPITITLHSDIDDQNPDTKGTIYADNAVLETGVSTFDNAALITACNVNAKGKNGTADTNITVTDTDSVVAAMKAGKTGTYSVTFSITDGAAATVTVTLVDEKIESSGGKVLTANDFSIGTGDNTTVPTGNVTAKDIVDLSEAKLVKKNGVEIPLLDGNDLAAGVTVTGLDALNDAKTNGVYDGTYTITLTYTDSGETVSAEIKVTLDSTRYLYDFDWNGSIDSNDINTMMAINSGNKVTSGETCTEAWLCVLDGDASKAVDANDVNGAIRIVANYASKVYIKVPAEYLQYLK